MGYTEPPEARPHWADGLLGTSAQACPFLLCRCGFSRGEVPGKAMGLGAPGVWGGSGEQRPSAIPGRGGHPRRALGLHRPVPAKARPAYRVLSASFLSTRADRGYEKNTCQFTSEKPVVLSSPARRTRTGVRMDSEHRLGGKMSFGCTSPGGKWSQEPPNRSGLFSVRTPPESPGQFWCPVSWGGTPTRAPHLPR